MAYINLVLAFPDTLAPETPETGAFLCPAFDLYGGAA